MKQVLEILKNYKFVKKDFYYMVIGSIVFESINLLYPKITQYLIQVIEDKRDIEDLYYWIAILIGFTIIYIITRIIGKYFGIRVWINLFKEKSLYYQSKILEKNYKNIVNLGTGKLISRLDGVNSEADIFLSTISILIEAVLKGIIIIIILYFHIPQLVVVVLLGIFILSICNFYLRKHIRKYNKKEVEAWEEYGRVKTRIAMDNLTIKLFLKSKLELFKAKKQLDKGAKNGIKVDTINELYYSLLEGTIRFLEIGVFLILGIIIIEQGTYSISFLIMIIWYIWYLRNPIDKAISSLNRINRVWEKYKKLTDFINTPNDIKNGDNKFNYKYGKIEFKNINFSYSKGKYIFKNLDLKILAGKKNALIGHSGGGKSTITKILLRLYDYQKGKVIIDNQDLKKLKIETLYKHIGYLPQEPSIFDGTIRENLEYAIDSKKYSEKILWEALKNAQIDKMIKGLEHGLNTEIGEKGIKLSGGEKQRLAIARIFLKNPEIIILDEPTSALDSISEEKITQSLNKLMKGKTSIIVAHRLQTVINSNKIIVIENGKIESEGNHKDLLKKSKVYKKLVNLQNGTIIE